MCGKNEMLILKQWQSLLMNLELMAIENVSVEQVYNTDETTMYWYCILQKTLAQNIEEHLNGDKNSKHKITILGYSNAVNPQCNLMLMIKRCMQGPLKG